MISVRALALITEFRTKYTARSLRLTTTRISSLDKAGKHDTPHNGEHEGGTAQNFRSQQKAAELTRTWEGFDPWTVTARGPCTYTPVPPRPGCIERGDSFCGATPPSSLPG